MVERNPIELKFWMNQGDLGKLASAAEKWWDEIVSWSGKVAKQTDAATLPLSLLDLLAWERDIKRLDGESEALYRLRVKHALANARDAGETMGFKRIWERLGLGKIDIAERVDPADWDVVLLEMDETKYSEVQDVVDELIRMYGRTCRRYTLGTRKAVEVDCHVLLLGTSTEKFVARWPSAGQLVTSDGYELWSSDKRRLMIAV